MQEATTPYCRDREKQRVRHSLPPQCESYSANRNEVHGKFTKYEITSSAALAPQNLGAGLGSSRPSQPNRVTN